MRLSVAVAFTTLLFVWLALLFVDLKAAAVPLFGIGMIAGLEWLHLRRRRKQ